MTELSLTQFDALYAHRHQSGNLKACVTAIADAERVPEPEFEWLWRAARLEHFRAMQGETAGETATARAHFRAGQAYAVRAEALRPQCVESVFWHGVCALEAGRLGGNVAAMAALGPAEKRIELASRLDETFHYAGPLRVLGRITQRKPLLLGGSLDRALAFYNSALQLAPDHSTTLLYQGDCQYWDKQPDAAKRTLHHLLTLPPAAGWQWETARDQEQARKMLAEWFR